MKRRIPPSSRCRCSSLVLENSSAIITSDISQVDLPRSKESGLVHATRILQGINSLDFVYFDSRDVFRSIVSQIIEAYAANGKREENDESMRRKDEIRETADQQLWLFFDAHTGNARSLQ